MKYKIGDIVKHKQSGALLEIKKVDGKPLGYYPIGTLPVQENLRGFLWQEGSYRWFNLSEVTEPTDQDFINFLSENLKDALVENYLNSI